MSLQNKKNTFIVVCLTFLFLSIIPFFSFAGKKPQTIYTIQIASHRDIKIALKDFDVLTKKLDKKNLDYLRIEKIGKFYSLRLGKFKDRAGAEKLSKSIKSLISSHMIMDVYFIEKRILKMYKSPEAEEKLVTKPGTAREAVSKTVPQKEEPAQEMEVPRTEETLQEKEVPRKEEVSQEVKPSKVPEGVDDKAEEHNKPESLEQKIASVATLVQRENYTEALEIIEPEITVQPMHTELNAWYGAVLLKMNRPAEALEYLDNAVKLSPNVSDYHNSLGYCLFFLNRHDDAIHEFQRAVTLDPEHVDALTGLGIIYGQQGDKEKAVDIYNILKKLDKNTADKLMKIINEMS